jgi:radical SAM protein with 4Fe4S-binding SPASM domain
MPHIYAERPQRIYWEVTRACDLACRHCRAEASPEASPNQLTPAEGLQLLEQLAGFGAPLPHLVLTGGDALKRDDLFELIAAARNLGFAVSVAPSATPLLTTDALRRLRGSGVDAISLSLDGSTAERHDRIRGIHGTYERTIAAARVAREEGLPFQVNTLVCEETVDDLAAIYEQVVEMGAARWSLFFLVTVGRGEVLAAISPERAESLLEWISTLGGRPGSGKPIVTTTEAPHLRRITSQRHRGPSNHGAGIRDGNGIMFISHVGDICPSGFLEIPTGNVRNVSVVDVYRSASLFQMLRSPEQFADRCGRCEFHFVCGGSRARAYASSGNPLGQDPLCLHEPRREALSN